MSAGGSGELWVFAYGSLMWDPGFDHEHCAPAILGGYHRAFCVLSMSHRGTPAQPGLVLGLAPGGRCRGIVYRVAQGRERAARAYLFERELRRYEVYRERMLPLRLGDRRLVAQTYIADPSVAGYAGDLPDAEAARRIIGAAGERGPNFDYLERTALQLRTLGIREPAIERIYALALAESGKQA